MVGPIEQPARMMTGQSTRLFRADMGINMSAMQTTAMVHWLPIVRGEFLEVPGLHLTKPQVRRLWGLDSNTCDALLDTLVDRGFLMQTHDGTYARVDVINGWPCPRRPPSNVQGGPRLCESVVALGGALA